MKLEPCMLFQFLHINNDNTTFNLAAWYAKKAMHMNMRFLLTKAL